ncbi:lytic transglycosylase domain-containing protein [Bacillus daqingensis]|uniref:Lytic transglycosylase domain-containing protein n=1 Tax=Bacillus daqingensis TaxID=872396 RepID=A0ABV9NXZ1_9BACI
MNRSFLTMLAATIFLIGTTFLLGSGYIESKQEVSTQTSADRKAGESKTELDEHFLSLEEEINKLPERYEVSGAVNWQEAEETAALLYEDSDGEFQKDWGLLLALEAEKHDISPLLVYELLRVETGDTFDPDLVGPETKYGHAYGLAQFMENTGPWIAEKAGLPYERELLFDPHYAIQLSVTYLDYLYEKYGDWDYALTAYHRGMSGMEAYVEENGDPASWYAVEIQEEAERTASR